MVHLLRSTLGTLLTVLLFSACGPETADPNEDSMAREGPPCDPGLPVMPANWHALPDEGRLLVLSGLRDDTAADHRLIHLFATETCERLAVDTLPAGGDYRLASITFNRLSHLLGIRGANRIFVYDMDRGTLLPELEPEYESAVAASGGQPGAISTLEVWEDFLVGHQEGQGTFVFDLRDPTAPASVMPEASYEPPSGARSALFLLPSGPEFQAMVPTYNPRSGALDLNLIFDQPEALFPQRSEQSPDGRYVILRVSDVAQSRAAVIDMRTGTRLRLPPVYQRGNSDQIFEYLRSRE